MWTSEFWWMSRTCLSLKFAFWSSYQPCQLMGFLEISSFYCSFGCCCHCWYSWHWTCWSCTHWSCSHCFQLLSRDFSGLLGTFSGLLGVLKSTVFRSSFFSLFYKSCVHSFLLLQVSGFMLALMPIPYCNFSVLDGFLASFNTFAYSSLVSGRQIRRYTSRDDAIFCNPYSGQVLVFKSTWQMVGMSHPSFCFLLWASMFALLFCTSFPLQVPLPFLAYE
jgi:hypothetical protein